MPFLSTVDALPVSGLLAAAYLYGSVPFGFLAAKLLKGVDIRTTGSGNIGATNAARVLGFRFFPVIMLLDMSKGFVPTFLASRYFAQGGYEPAPVAVAAGLCAILGHVFPVYLHFKGGKAVATGTGVFLVLAPWAVLIAAGIWAAVFAVWRYVSLASVSAAVTLPVAFFLVYGDPGGTGRFGAGFSIVAAAFVIYLHRGNIRRLLAGTENRIGRRKPKPDEEGE
jgi:glycerol-3-phosphate acyltransferase PlsY